MVADLREYENWTEKGKAKLLAAIQERENSDWKPFYCPIPTCNGKPHEGWDFPHAREKQRPPKWSDPWQSWLVTSGRGFGKTLTGSHLTHQVAKNCPHLGLIAPTGPDIRETLVEGPTGILATSPPGWRPDWEPSRKRLVWPNGAIAYGMSAEEPDRIRSKNLGFAWLDEAAFMSEIEEVWSNLLFALRVKYGINGKPIRNHILVTTTPTPTPWIKARLKDPVNIVTSGSTYENIENLSDQYRDAVLSAYEGTRLGRQEIYGEVLDDVEGALWKPDMIQHIEEGRVPDLDRIIVAVDPAGSANARSDETGIIVIGRAGKALYVLADLTDKYSPAGWADAAHSAYEDFSADAIVAEKNYGGDMVKHTLETTGKENVRVLLVDSRRGKQLRAEPIVGLYERCLVWHVKGKNRTDLAKLESEQVEWVPGKGASPNRVDALVHGATELYDGTGGPASISDPTKLRGMRSPHNRFLGGRR